MDTMTDRQAMRGHDGLKIVSSAPSEKDLIADTGVKSEMLLTSRSLFLKRELIAPSTSALRHLHSTASIIVMLAGSVRVNYGSTFQYTDYVEAGEFIFIPALMPHQPVNESSTDPIVCLVVRDAPSDEVILYKMGQDADTI